MSGMVLLGMPKVLSIGENLGDQFGFSISLNGTEIELLLVSQ